LADFGFARAVSASNLLTIFLRKCNFQLPTHSLASTLCGSPLYMAPEILRGDRYDGKELF
jgi:serine/threonine protein kinase